MKKSLATAAIVFGMVALPLAPSSADWSTWTPRQGWCALVPAWCR